MQKRLILTLLAIGLFAILLSGCVKVSGSVTQGYGSYWYSDDFHDRNDHHHRPAPGIKPERPSKPKPLPSKPPKTRPSRPDRPGKR